MKVICINDNYYGVQSGLALTLNKIYDARIEGKEDRNFYVIKDDDNRWCFYKKTRFIDATQTIRNNKLNELGI